MEKSPDAQTSRKPQAAPSLPPQGELIGPIDGEFYAHLAGYGTRPTYRVSLDLWRRYSCAVGRQHEIAAEDILATGRLP
jgi:hypothetical protein